MTCVFWKLSCALATSAFQNLDILRISSQVSGTGEDLASGACWVWVSGSAVDLASGACVDLASGAYVEPENGVDADLASGVGEDLEIGVGEDLAGADLATCCAFFHIQRHGRLSGLTYGRGSRTPFLAYHRTAYHWTDFQ